MTILERFEKSDFRAYTEGWRGYSATEHFGHFHLNDLKEDKREMENEEIRNRLDELREELDQSDKFLPYSIGPAGIGNYLTHGGYMFLDRFWEILAEFEMLKEIIQEREAMGDWHIEHRGEVEEDSKEDE